MSYTVSSAIKLKAESNDRAYNIDFQPLLANILSPSASSFSLLVPPLGGEVSIQNLSLDVDKYPVSFLIIQAQRPFDVSLSLDVTDPLLPVPIYSGKFSLLYANQFSGLLTGLNLRFDRLDHIKIKSHPLVDSPFLASAFVSHGLLL